MLSEGAKTILRHFRDEGASPLEFANPDTLRQLFSSPTECELAETELQALGYVELGPEPSVQRVRSAAIALEGERYIADNEL